MPLPNLFTKIPGAIGTGVKTVWGGIKHKPGTGTVGERVWGATTKVGVVAGGIAGGTAFSKTVGDAIARDRTTFAGTSDRFNRNGYSATIANRVSTGQMIPDELGENDYSKLNQRFGNTLHEKPKKETMVKAASMIMSAGIAGLEFMGYKDTKKAYVAQAKLPKALPPQVTGMKQPNFF